MKKIWMIAALSALLTGTVLAEPMIGKGTRELTLQGFLDFETKDDYLVHLGIGYGKFFWDGVELGLNLSYSGDDASRRINLGPFAEYNHATGSEWVPYVNFATKWVNADVDFGRGTRLVNTNSDALLLAGEAGVKYFIADNVAISGGFAYEWATSEIFDADDDLENGNGLFKLGMRVFF